MTQSAIKSALDGKVSTARKINNKALSADITLSASDVGADASGAAATALTDAKSYTDTKIAALVDSAPDTMNTLNELATAIKDHKDVTDALDAAISSKASKDVATTSAAGLMSSAMVTKLNSIEDGANKTVVDTALSSSSTNPVQNKVVNSALSGKVPTTRKVNGKALSADITLSASDVSAYSKTEIDNMVFITVEDIDEICGSSIEFVTDMKGMF